MSKILKGKSFVPFSKIIKLLFINFLIKSEKILPIVCDLLLKLDDNECAGNLVFSIFNLSDIDSSKVGNYLTNI